MREEIAEIVAFELEDERIGSVEVTDVRLSPDGHHARVFVNLNGDKQDIDATLRALEHAAPFIRRQTTLRMNLRKTPHLHFVHDDIHASALRIEQILKETVGDAPEGE